MRINQVNFNKCLQVYLFYNHMLLGFGFFLNVFVFIVTCRYSEQPGYRFVVPDIEQFNSINIKLQTNSQQLFFFYLNNTIAQYVRRAVNFNGKKICQGNTSNQIFVGWPSHTGGLFLKNNHQVLQLIKYQSPCGSSSILQLSNMTGIPPNSFSENDRDSFFAIVLSGQKNIIEYNSLTLQKVKQFVLNPDASVLMIDYSSDHIYLYAVIRIQNSQRVVVFDAKTGDFLRQIPILQTQRSTKNFVKGHRNGKGFISLTQNATSITFFNVDEKGKQTKINFGSNNSENYSCTQVKICTRDNRIVCFGFILDKQTQEYSVFSFSSQNGSLLQTIPYKMQFDLKLMECNDNSLVLMDKAGNVEIYSYNEEKQQQQEQGKEDKEQKQNNSSGFPGWLIGLIIVWIIVMGLIALIYFIKNREQKGEQHVEFNDEEIAKRQVQINNDLINNSDPIFGITNGNNPQNGNKQIQLA